MVGWWSTGEINEETPLYDDLDPLKEWLVDPDCAQVQNPNNLSNVGLDICEIHSTEIKLEQKGEILGSSIDEKMEKVSLLEVSDLCQEVGLKENGVENVLEMVTLLEFSDLCEGEVGLKENRIENVVEMASLLEVSDLCQGEVGLKEVSDLCEGEVGLKENRVENVVEMVSLLDVSDLCQGEVGLKEVSDLFQGEVGLKENINENVSEMVSLLEVSNPCQGEVGLKEVSDLFQGEVGLKENRVENVSEMVSLLEVSDPCQGEVGLKENGVENVLEMNVAKACLEDLKSDQPSKEGTDKVDSGEKESAYVTAEAGSGDSSSDESSRNESSSITKSLSSSDDEDTSIKRIKEAEELEEGEVRDFDAHVMDFSYEEGEVPKGPISSKHEVKDLPPVPIVEVSLQPHHQMLPVGVILSIMSNRVIVEGSVRHNPLDEGSILWATDTRSPLGLIDEIFGPVKNPYYVVRYNTEQEVPAGVRVGIAISFVVEFASQILYDKELYKKGYDASGENDEEIDELEFSDDEKEAAYRQSLRQSKVPTNDGKGMKQEAWVGRKRSTFMGSTIQHKDIQTQQTNDGKGVKQEARVDRKRSTFMDSRIQYKEIQTQQTSAPLSFDPQRATDMLPQPTSVLGHLNVGPGCWDSSLVDRKRSTFMGSRIQYKEIQTQQTSEPLSIDLQRAPDMLPQPTSGLGHPSVGPGCWDSSSGMTNANVAAPPRVTNFPQGMQAANFFGNPSQQLLIQHPPDAPWAPGFSSHLQNTGMHDGLATQLQNQNLLLNNLVNMVAFQQQLQQLISNPGSTLPWFGAAPSLQPLGQNNFAPSPFVNGLANFPGTPGLGNEQIHGQALTPFAPPSLQFSSGSSSSLQFNAGSSNSRGRRPYQRGGGRFFGRGGRQPNR